ncbi:hypothetical protein H9P43_005848 [Blastocladiella emersonii ATCC 22665]|nr:hypothetical protein H9P43_005848 [Blastocladiella emersonii ATCC 22665]
MQPIATMKHLRPSFLALLVALLAAVACMTASAAKETPAPGSAVSPAPVLELAAGNFTSAVNDGTTMVFFYAPWCPHCKRAAPALRNFARKTKAIQKKHGFKVAMINCEANEATCDAHNIDGFPTYLVFQRGRMLFEYEGDTDSDSLATFAKEAAEYNFVFTERGDGAAHDASQVNDGFFGHEDL